MVVKWRPKHPLPSARHRIQLFRIERGRRVLRFEHTEPEDDDYWHIVPGGPEVYATAYAHAYFLKHHIPAGQRWIIVVDVLPTRQGDSPQRLCEVHLTVPPEDDIAEKRIGPPQPILSYLLRTP